MPRLPSAADFGQRPEVRPSGGIAQIQTLQGSEAAGMAIANAGQDLVQVGQAIQVAEDRLTAARRASQLADALGKASAELGKMEVDFSRDQDFKTSHKRFTEASEGLGKKYEGLIDDGVVKQSFHQQFQRLAVSKQLNVLKQSVKQEGDYHVASLNDSEQQFALSASTAGNDMERKAIFNAYHNSVTELQQAGWITRVDANERQRKFLTRVDEARVEQDLHERPGETASNLQFDSTTYPNLDPKDRMRLAIKGWDKESDEKKREEAEKEKAHQASREEIMKRGWDLDAKGQLTARYAREVRNIVTDAEYHALLKGAENGRDRESKPDNAAAYAVVLRTMKEDPDQAREFAFAYHKQGLLKNSTLGTFDGNARTQSRQESPKSVFETESASIPGLLGAGGMFPDPAASARSREAMREFDDYVRSGKRTDKEIRDKSNEVVDKWALTNMRELARKSSTAVRNTPEAQMEVLRQQAETLEKRYKARKVDKGEYDRKIIDMNKTRKAIEKLRTIRGD